MLIAQRTNRTGTALVLKTVGYAGLAVAATLSRGAYAESKDSELAELKKQIQLLTSSVVTLQKRVEKAESTASKAETQTSKLHSRVEKAESSAAKAESQTAELSTRVENTESQVAQVAPGGAPPATQDDIQGIQSDLESFKWQWQRERETHTALSTRNLTIGGIVQAGYEWNQSNLSYSPANSVNANNSFYINTALLRFTGNLYRDYEEGRNLEYQISTGVSPQTGSPSFNLLDAQISYNFLPTINQESSRLKVTLGQQLIPFGIEVNATEDLKPLIRNAMWTQPGTTGLGDRQIGAFIRGDAFPQVDYGANYRAPILEYAVGVFNGNGPNKLDNNRMKDWMGRLALTAPVDYNSWFRELKIGTSAYFGTQNVQETYYSNPTTKTKATQYLDNGDRNRVGVDLSYNHHPLGLTFEWVHTWDTTYPGVAPTKNASPYTVVQEGEGYTTTVFYNFGAQFVKSYRAQGRYDDWWPKTYQVFFRWDTWDPNLHARNDKLTYLIPGINIFFAETTKLQLNYYHQTLEADKPRNDEFWAQLQFGF